MGYNKKTWVSGETITKEALNNIENGIAKLDEKVQELEIDYDTLLAFDTEEIMIGCIDNEGNIVISNNLPEGLYTLVYEYEDGTEIELDNFTI